MKGLHKNDWRAIRQRILDGECTPIFSDRLYSRMWPGYDDITKAWGDDIEYPLGRDYSLTRLAQYLSVTYGDETAKGQFLTFVKAYFVAQKTGKRIDQILNEYGRQLSKARLSSIINE